MHSCTEAHPAPSVALEAPVELPPRASALAAWHRAKAGGAVDRAEGCRRPSRGELRANGATRGVNACTAARRHILRHRLPSKLLANSLQERPPSPHGTVRRRAVPSIERRAAGGLREEKWAPMARHVVSTHAQLHGERLCVGLDRPLGVSATARSTAPPAPSHGAMRRCRRLQEGDQEEVEGNTGACGEVGAARAHSLSPCTRRITRLPERRRLRRRRGTMRHRPQHCVIGRNHRASRYSWCEITAHRHLKPGSWQSECFHADA